MKFYLNKVRINQGGYDCNGRYFGIGLPLYLFESVDYVISDYIRSPSREHAKNLIKQRCPNAIFFR